MVHSPENLSKRGVIAPHMLTVLLRTYWCHRVTMGCSNVCSKCAMAPRQPSTGNRQCLANGRGGWPAQGGMYRVRGARLLQRYSSGYCQWRLAFVHRCCTAVRGWVWVLQIPIVRCCGCKMLKGGYGSDHPCLPPATLGPTLANADHTVLDPAIPMGLEFFPCH
jgi:hypothetical protein